MYIRYWPTNSIFTCHAFYMVLVLISVSSVSTQAQDLATNTNARSSAKLVANVNAVSPFTNQSRETTPNSQLSLAESLVKDGWPVTVVAKANTAKDTNYLSPAEQDIILLWNLVRSNPKLFKEKIESFCATYCLNEGLYQPSYVIGSQYYKSLLADLAVAKQLPPLAPHPTITLAAKRYAQIMSKSGALGHNADNSTLKSRLEKLNIFAHAQESIDYGYALPANVIMHLLIDEGVKGMGHRKAIIEEDKCNYIGVSKQPHTIWTFTVVIDCAALPIQQP